VVDDQRRRKEADAYADAFLAKETEQYRENLAWLRASMPETFFSEVGEENVLLVAHNLVGFDLQDYYSLINLRNAAIILCLDDVDADSKIYTKYQKRGIQTMHTFISEKPLLKIDKYLRIGVVFFAEPTEEEKTKEAAFDCDGRFWMTLNEKQKEVITSLESKAQKSDLVECELIKSPNGAAKHSLELFVACSGAPRFFFVPRLLRILMHKKICSKGMTLTFSNAQAPERMLLLVCTLHGQDGKPCWECTDIEKLIRELLFSRHFSLEDLFEETYVPFGDGLCVYFLRACAYFVHEVLVHQDPNMYTLQNVQEALCYWPEIGQHLYHLFRLKFDPFMLDKTKYKELKQNLLDLINKQDTGKELSDIRRKSVLHAGVSFVDATLKTNFFVSNKGALAFRLDAGFLQELDKDFVSRFFPKPPFAVFFIQNRDFFGFHIRFQDLARGGVRTIALKNIDLVKEEMPLIFSECYQLAYTQQKKNKDLPEGGAKGILFLMPREDLDIEEKLVVKEGEDIKQVTKTHFFAYLYRSQRLFIESLLSLVNCDGEGRLKEKSIVDYYLKPEYLYIGPDENMHDAMIEWIAEYAKKVDYKPKSAFITSKPRIGINHKRYGATSLGVNCCMEEALKFLKINPQQTVFTVKMSGGPDGDVAGNQILNLHRRYPNTARLVTLIDASGVIYDPQGLDLAICEKLFHQTKPIRFYPPERLSEGGFLLDMFTERRESLHIVEHLCHKKKGGALGEEWLTASQAHQITRSFVHKTQTDVFIPAGGRPGALGRVNIRDFMTPENTPTAKIIIEGANLYLTQAARKLLEDKEVIIIKDSSANKGGVICSSFEVLASLSLSDEEFIEHKEQIVKEILHKIEEYARLEVQLLLRTYSDTGEPCSQVSEKVSERIDYFSDQIRAYLEALCLSDDPKDPLLSCFIEHSLPLLVEKFPKQLLEKIPEVHKKAIIASWIASKVVYHRGLSWAPSIVDVLPMLCQDPRITSCLIRW